MEAFKFAFETIVIGLLALPWLVMMLDLARAQPLTVRSLGGLVEAIPGDSGPTLFGMALVAVTYVLGSAISPVACEFLNDEDWIGHVLPTEHKTQVRAYLTGVSLQDGKQLRPMNAGAGCETAARPYKGTDFSENECWEEVLHKFEMEESSLQLKGTDRTEHINRLRERLSVLQGATFSAFVFMLLLVFALGSGYRAKVKDEAVDRKGEPATLNRLISGVMAFLPPLLIVALALLFGAEDLVKGDVTDMPIMEAVLLFLGAFGLYLAARPIKPRVYVNAWSCLFALFVAVLMYGGYACTEVNYDQEVHATYAAAAAQAQASRESTAVQTAMNDVASER